MILHMYPASMSRKYNWPAATEHI